MQKNRENQRRKKTEIECTESVVIGWDRTRKIKSLEESQKPC